MLLHGVSNAIFLRIELLHCCTARLSTQVQTLLGAWRLGVRGESRPCMLQRNRQRIASIFCMSCWMDGGAGSPPFASNGAGSDRPSTGRRQDAAS